jgi:hypothetical protein
MSASILDALERSIEQHPGLSRVCVVIALVIVLILSARMLRGLSR